MNYIKYKVKYTISLSDFLLRCFSYNRVNTSSSPLRREQWFLNWRTINKLAVIEGTPFFLNEFTIVFIVRFNEVFRVNQCKCIEWLMEIQLSLIWLFGCASPNGLPRHVTLLILKWELWSVGTVMCSDHISRTSLIQLLSYDGGCQFNEFLSAFIRFSA